MMTTHLLDLLLDTHNITGSLFWVTPPLNRERVPPAGTSVAMDRKGDRALVGAIGVDAAGSVRGHQPFCPWRVCFSVVGTSTSLRVQKECEKMTNECGCRAPGQSSSTTGPGARTTSDTSSPAGCKLANRRASPRILFSASSLRSRRALGLS